MSDNNILLSFLSPLFESDSNTDTYFFRQNLVSRCIFSYFLHDVHLPEYFELRLIFGLNNQALVAGNNRVQTSLCQIAECYKFYTRHPFISIVFTAVCQLC